MKNFIRISILVTLTLSVILTAAVCLAACNDTPDLPPFLKAEDSEDGYATVYVTDADDMEIMVLSDPQVDATEKYKTVGSLGNDVTYSFIEDFVAATDPDLVVINGDLVMLDSFVASQVPYFVRYAEIFERLETPWTFTFGNHDCDAMYATGDDPDNEYGQCTKDALITKMASYEHCLITSDETCKDGAGNHFVNIRDKSGALIGTLCLFDCVYTSQFSDYEPVPTAEQVRWYRDTIESISDAEFGEDRAEDEVVTSYIFNHVGVPEFKEAWDAAWNDGEPTEAYHYGHWMEGNYSSKYGDMPESEQIFTVAKELGSTKAIFMCHHHDNDFSVDYEGIRLTFGQHSGYSHYYRTDQSSNSGGAFGTSHDIQYWKGIDFSLVDDYGDERGGTLLTLHGDGTFDIEPVYARDAIADYAEKYYIDYDAVAAAIENDPDYTGGPIIRGTDRAWKLPAEQ